MEITSISNDEHHPTTNAGSIPITRSDPNNPYPTTFVTADTCSFKQVVQMLTGSSDPTTTSPPVRTAPNKQASKLYQRRNNNTLSINKISPLSSNNHISYIKHSDEIISPASLLDFPSLTLSPVTPLVADVFDISSVSTQSDEEKAIAEKGFYLHPSPLSTPRDREPRLLPLFPLSSPRETN